MCEWIVRCRADEEAVLVCHLLAEQAASLFAVRDAELFVLAVHEAVVNAVKAVQRAGMEAGTISLSFFVTSADVAVAVEDEGGGVPAEVIEQLDQMTLSDVLLAESGRGLLLIREIMDDVTWVEQKGGRRMLVMKMSRNAT